MTIPTTPPPPVVPPRRSRRRWYLLGGFALLLVAVPVGYVLISGWLGDQQLQALYAEMDAEDPNWRWPDLLAESKPMPDDSNSALQLLKIQAMFKKTPFNPGMKWETASERPLLHPSARLSEETADLLRPAFAALPKEVLAEARKLKDMPTGHFVVEPMENHFAVNLDHIQKVREVAYLLSNDATLLSHDQDHEGAAESCQALVNTASSLSDQPFLISQLVRMAVQGMAVGAIERTLGQGNVSEENLAKLQSLLEAEADADGLGYAMRGERAGSHHTYLNLREGKTSFSELFGMTGLKTGIGERALDLFPGVILNSYPDYLQLMNEQVRASKLKDAERVEAFQKAEQHVREKHRSLLISVMMPATSKVAQAAQRLQARMRCTITALAAERYRLKHDAWPRGIDDLVKSGLLKETLKDPYDGKLLRFRRTPAGVLVYSVGPDKTDNGGKLDRAGACPPEFDFGFELWDRRGTAPVIGEEISK